MLHGGRDLEATMQIAIGIPTQVAAPPTDVFYEWARRADEGPFSSLAETDRIVARGHEPMIALAAAAGVTRRIRLMTSVLLAPTRETTLLAMQCASLDVLSGGRLSLGVGVGARTDDYEATGFPFTRRGRRLDEQLSTLRRMWAGEGPADGLGPVGPRPVSDSGPEVLVGGYVPAVARRIAQWGDGFAEPGGGDPQAMQELWGEIVRAWEEAGRQGRPRRVASSYYALGPEADEVAASYIRTSYAARPEYAEQRLRRIPRGDTAVRDLIAMHTERGADELVLRPCVAELDQLDRLAELVG